MESFPPAYPWLTVSTHRTPQAMLACCVVGHRQRRDATLAGLLMARGPHFLGMLPFIQLPLLLQTDTLFVYLIHCKIDLPTIPGYENCLYRKFFLICLYLLLIYKTLLTNIACAGIVFPVCKTFANYVCCLLFSNI